MIRLLLILALCASAHAYEAFKTDGSVCRWYQPALTYSVTAPASVKLALKRAALDAASKWGKCLGYSLPIRGVNGRADVQIVYEPMEYYAGYTELRTDIWGRILAARITVSTEERYFAALLLHEFGHALGLEDVSGLACMNSHLWWAFRWPMTDDIKGVRWLYGLDGVR